MTSLQPTLVILCGMICGMLAGWLVGISEPIITTVAIVIIFGIVLAVLSINGLQQKRRASRGIEGRPASTVSNSSSELHKRYADVAVHSTLSNVSRYTFYAGIACMSFLLIRPFATTTVSDLLFLLALGILLMDRLVASQPFRVEVPSALFVGIVVFFMGALLSSIGAASSLGSLTETIKFMFLVGIWIGLGTEILRSTSHILTAMTFWVVSVAVAGGGAVAQKFLDFQVAGSYDNWGRYSGFTGHVNDLGGMSAIALVPAVALLFCPIARWTKAFVVLPSTLLIMSGLLLSGSVAGLGSALVASLIFVFLMGSASITWGAALLVAGYLANLKLGYVDYIFTGTLGRIVTVTDQSSERGSLWSRLETYQEAWKRILENPIVGTGLDPISKLTPVGYPVHNIVLGLWYQAGIFGAAGMALILLTIVVTWARSFENARTRSDVIVVSALGSAISAFIVFAQSAPILYQRYTWIPVLLLMSLYAAESRANADRAATTGSTRIGNLSTSGLPASTRTLRHT